MSRTEVKACSGLTADRDRLACVPGNAGLVGDAAENLAETSNGPLYGRVAWGTWVRKMRFAPDSNESHPRPEIESPATPE